MWVMRQAGRHLPEYRALKEQYTFHELVQTPELAHEVTMQPIRRYGMDAAILFSDILVIPEAMGQRYEFRGKGGIEMAFRVETRADIDRLEVDGVEERLDYVTQTLKLLRATLGDETALIGFGGAPWTLATYMVEGGSSKDYSHAKRMFYTDREAFEALMEKVTEASIRYFKAQVAAGADAIQLFDSWGGVLAPDAFWDASAKWMARITEALGGKVPVIVFSKGAHERVDELLKTRPNILGADWTTRLSDFRRQLPENVGVQGNLDPVLLETNPATVRQEVTQLLESMRGLNGHIFNLGHGIAPSASIANMEALVQTVREFGA